MNSQLPVVKTVKVAGTTYGGKVFSTIPKGSFSNDFVAASGGGFDGNTDANAEEVATLNSCIDPAAAPAEFQRSLELRIKYIESIIAQSATDGFTMEEKILQFEPRYNPAQDATVSFVAVGSNSSTINYVNAAQGSSALEYLSTQITEKLAAAKVFREGVVVTIDGCKQDATAATVAEGSMAVQCTISMDSADGQVKDSDAATILKASRGMAALWTSGMRVPNTLESFQYDFSVDLWNADGVHLTKADPDASASNIVAAVATRSVAASLVTPKNNDASFDEHLRLLQVFGTKSKTPKEKKADMGKFIADISNGLSMALPFDVVEFKRLYLGSTFGTTKYGAHVPQVVIENMEFKWFMDADGAPMIDLVAVERKVADVLLYAGLQYELQSLKRALYGHIAPTDAPVYTGPSTEAVATSARKEYSGTTTGALVAEQLALLRKNYIESKAELATRISEQANAQTDLDAAVEANSAKVSAAKADYVACEGGLGPADKATHANHVAEKCQGKHAVFKQEEATLLMSLSNYENRRSTHSLHLQEEQENTCRLPRDYAEDIASAVAFNSADKDKDFRDKNTNMPTAKTLMQDAVKDATASVDAVSTDLSTRNSKASVEGGKYKVLAAKYGAEETTCLDAWNSAVGPLYTPGTGATDAQKDALLEDVDTDRAAACAFESAAKKHYDGLVFAASKKTITSDYGFVSEADLVIRQSSCKDDKQDADTAAQALVNHEASVQAQVDEADKSDDSMIIIIAALVVVIFLICIIVVAVLMLKKSPTDNGAFKHNPNAIAFENPSYQQGGAPGDEKYNPMAEAYSDGAYGGQGYGDQGYGGQGTYGSPDLDQGTYGSPDLDQGLVGGDSIDDNGELYDEPEMLVVADGEPDGGAGYLDVQPDGEDANSDDGEDDDSDEDEGEDGSDAGDDAVDNAGDDAGENAGLYDEPEVGDQDDGGNVDTT